MQSTTNPRGAVTMANKRIRKKWAKRQRQRDAEVAAGLAGLVCVGFNVLLNALESGGPLADALLGYLDDVAGNIPPPTQGARS